VTVQERRLLIDPASGLGPARINTMLVREGLEVSHLALQRPTLEDVFLELTQ
jgi:hypothetical protein